MPHSISHSRLCMLSYSTCVGGDTIGGKLQDADPSRRQHSPAYTLANPRNQSQLNMCSCLADGRCLEAAEELQYKLVIVTHFRICYGLTVLAPTVSTVSRDLQIPSRGRVEAWSTVDQMPSALTGISPSRDRRSQKVHGGANSRRNGTDCNKSFRAKITEQAH
jgi:hypothetical protein